MSIIIKGMEMPTEEEIGKCIIIRHDGEVWIVEFDNLVDGGYVCCYPTNPARAVPVPPHGRCIDGDALWGEINKICDRRDAGIISDLTCLQQLLSAVRHAPTIIPASEEGE